MATTVTTVTFNRFAEIARRLPQATGEVVEETLYEIETDIKIGMEGPHTGRIYGSHQASAPGEMPAVDTSNLVNSITAEMDGETSGAVYTNVEYAARLECGMQGIRPRPYMTPAAENARRGFERRMQELEGRLD